jgi:hypothetical protein
MESEYSLYVESEVQRLCNRLCNTVSRQFILAIYILFQKAVSHTKGDVQKISDYVFIIQSFSGQTFFIERAGII